MSDPLLWVRVDRYPLRGQGVKSEFVVASPDDIGRAAEKLGYARLDVDALEAIEEIVEDGRTLLNAISDRLSALDPEGDTP